MAFPNDRILPKSLVAAVYFLELVQIVLATYDGFRNFGYGWGDMVALNDVGIIWFSIPAMTSTGKMISFRNILPES